MTRLLRPEEVSSYWLPTLGLPEGPPLALEPEHLPRCGERPADVTPMSDRDLARIAMDYAAGVGDDAPAWMLGWWWELLDVGRAEHLRAWRAAVASAAFTLAPGWSRTPFRSWCRDEPRPDAVARLPLIAVMLTPMMPWRLERRVEGGWLLGQLLPVQPWWVPEGPVNLDDVGWFGAPPVEGDVLFGRVVPQAGAAPVVRCGVMAPRRPEVSELRAHFARVAGPMRTALPAIKREDIYRRAGHHLLALTCRADQVP